MQNVDSRSSFRGRAFLRAVASSIVLLALVGPTTTVRAEGKGRNPRNLGVPGVRGGVVTTSEPIAAQVGAEVLRAGGNAIDAAAAVQFVLNVVEPQSSGIGGGGFMMIHLARTGETFVVDSRERAPAAATPDMFASQASNFGLRSTSGYAVGVPGTLLGVAESVARWGRKDLAELIAPAIRLAEEGFRVSSRLADSVTSSRLQNERDSPSAAIRAAYQVARDVFVPGGEPVTEGQLLRQPDLARTFRLIAQHGIDVFYRGEIAAAVVEAQKTSRTDNPDGVGRMTLQDLDTYEVALREPVSKRYRGYRVVSMPPPSSGGLTVLQILELLERFPIGDAQQGFGFGSPRTLNVMIEAMRLAYADRAVWMGDDDFVPVPSVGLLARGYLEPRSALIDPDGRQVTVQADDPRPFDPRCETPRMTIAGGTLPDEEGVNTTHFTVVDRRGNVVAYTTTIESAWGTGLMVPGYGFLLNNELTDFNSTPQANPDPNAFNPGANDVAPFKRPRSSMAPTMIFAGRRPVAAFGSPGGSSIITTVVNVTLNLIDHRRTIQEAIDLPRLATLSAAGFTFFEYGFEEDAIGALRALGHGSLLPTSALGSVQAVVLDADRRAYGAADRRRIGGVVSVRRSQVARRR